MELQINAGGQYMLEISPEIFSVSGSDFLWGPSTSELLPPTTGSKILISEATTRSSGRNHDAKNGPWSVYVGDLTRNLIFFRLGQPLLALLIRAARL